MRVLIGTIVAGEAKAYAVPSFEAMAGALFSGLDVLAVVDRPGRTSLPELVDDRMAGSHWATEIVSYGKQTLRDHALSHGYDALLWQGIDCFYSGRRELARLLLGAEEYAICGALVAGRDREDYPVCRKWVRDGEHFTRAQRECPEVTDGPPGRHLVAGYIGSDATVIRADALKVVSMDGYEHWHLRSDRDHGALGPEEWFMWSAAERHGIIPCIDTRVRPWHAHETGRCVRYRGQVCEISELSWPRAFEGARAREVGEGFQAGPRDE